MILKSTLLSGAGNTFHIFYKTDTHVDLVQKICTKYPADGVVFLKALDVEENFYTWDFYNNDGSPAEMCGNATRCVGYYVEEVLKRPADQIKLQTTAGSIDIRALPHHQYKVRMPKAIVNSHSKYFFCNTGVPHVVLETPPDMDLAREIRKALNTNVTFVQKKLEGITAVSFERGVEDYTLACGTGAVAAALLMREKYGENKTTVEMPGGSLMIDMTDTDHPVMTGPVEYIKECTYEF